MTFPNANGREFRLYRLVDYVPRRKSARFTAGNSTTTTRNGMHNHFIRILAKHPVGSSSSSSGFRYRLTRRYLQGNPKDVLHSTAERLFVFVHIFLFFLSSLSFSEFKQLKKKKKNLMTLGICGLGDCVRSIELETKTLALDSN